MHRLTALIFLLACSDPEVNVPSVAASVVRVLYWSNEGQKENGLSVVSMIKVAVKNYGEDDTTVTVVAQSGVDGAIWSIDKQSLPLKAYQSATVLLYPTYVGDVGYYVYVVPHEQAKTGD